MHPHLSKVALVCLSLALFAGCLGSPIFNVTDAAITPASGKEASLQEVTKAIITASVATTPAWNMQVVKPGHILATLHIRSHVAKIDITYTTKSYSIVYGNSTNLKYDSTTNTIHNNYNSWIQRLDSAIKVNLATL